MPIFFSSGKTRFSGFNKLLRDLFTSFMNCLTTAWTLHAAELRGWLRHRVSNPALADNLLQDLFSKALVLSELSPEDREAITLCDLQGMAQADFARAMGLSLSAAKSRVQRARVRLRTQMSQVCQVQMDEGGRVSDFVPRALVE